MHSRSRIGSYLMVLFMVLLQWNSAGMTVVHILVALHNEHIFMIICQSLCLPPSRSVYSVRCTVHAAAVCLQCALYCTCSSGLSTVCAVLYMQQQSVYSVRCTVHAAAVCLQCALYCTCSSGLSTVCAVLYNDLLCISFHLLHFCLDKSYCTKMSLS